MRSNNLTEHAQKRKQQRGIDDLQLELLRVFGVDHYQKGGSNLSYIPARTLADLRNAIDKLQRLALIKGTNDNGVTLLRMEKRIHKTRYAA
jgi:hypothetical protein